MVNVKTLGAISTIYSLFVVDYIILFCFFFKTFSNFKTLYLHNEVFVLKIDVGYR